MRKRTRMALVGLGLAALCAAWLALSPGWTLSAMADAASAGDMRRLSSHVEDDAVRQSVAGQMAAQMAYAQSTPQGLDPRVAGEALRTARRMVGQLDTTQIVSGAFSGGRRPQVRRTGLTRFIAGAPGGDGGLEFELRGVTWKVVGIRPPGRP